MIIKFNTDKNISGDEKLESYINSSIADGLEHFCDHITRIEVHLSDENGNKTSPNDKRCMLEARLENRQPIAVTSQSNTIEEAVSNAIDKLKASLKTINGKVKDN